MQIQEGLTGFEAEKQQLQARLQWVEHENENLRRWLVRISRISTVPPPARAPI